MSDTPWDLSDVDAETREQAIAEAERRGVDLADYLADVLLRRVSFDHPEAQADTQSPVVIDPRLEDLERRVDYSIDVLDRSMSGLAGRIDRVEMLAADAADA